MALDGEKLLRHQQKLLVFFSFVVLNASNFYISPLFPWRVAVAGIVSAASASETLLLEHFSAPLTKPYRFSFSGIGVSQT